MIPIQSQDGRRESAPSGCELSSNQLLKAMRFDRVWGLGKKQAEARPVNMWGYRGIQEGVGHREEVKSRSGPWRASPPSAGPRQALKVLVIAGVAKVGSVHTQSKAHLQSPPQLPPRLPGCPQPDHCGFLHSHTGPVGFHTSPIGPFIGPHFHSSPRPPLHSFRHAFLYSFTPVCTLSPSPRLFLPLPLPSLCSSPG